MTIRYSGKTKGESKIHEYVEPWGYPIRLCTWTIQDDDIERCQSVNCKRCLAVLEGRHRPYVGIDLIKGNPVGCAGDS